MPANANYAFIDLDLLFFTLNKAATQIKLVA